MVRLGALWRKAAALLEQAGVEDAAFDARELCRLCCKADPLLAPDFPVPEAAQQRLAQLCARRARHEPLQYLLGECDFLHLTVEVGPGVLIPRADTECVAHGIVVFSAQFDNLVAHRHHHRQQKQLEHNAQRKAAPRDDTV